MNEILIYDVIGWGDSSAESVRKALQKADKTKPLEVRINSDGGSAFDGFAIFNAFKEWRQPVNVFVDGIAASAASVIMLAGTTVTMGPMSFVMIHEAWGGIAGNKRDARKFAELLENIDNVAATQYAQRMEKTAEDVAALLEAETWFNAEAAVEAKLADKIASNQRAMAFVERDPKNEFRNRWGYRNVPASLLVDPSIAMERRKVPVSADAKRRVDDIAQRVALARGTI